MNNYIWSGKKVRLRPVQPTDWELFHQNDMDTENARLCDEVHFPRLEEGTREWAEYQSSNTINGDNAFLAIETFDGTLVGSICTNNCNPRHGTFKYGVSIFRKHWRKGYASEAVSIILRYYFDELRYQKANAHVYAYNGRSIALQQHLGFVQEGRIRDMIFSMGKHHDEFIYGLTKLEYEKQYRKELPTD